MKDPLILQVEIDYCLWQLSEVARRPAGSPIEAMIDAACGRDTADRQAAVDILQNLVGLWGEWQEATGEDVSGFIASTQAAIATIKAQDDSQA